MGVDTIQINLVKTVNAVKLKAGGPKLRLKVFWIVWFGIFG